MTFTHRQLPNVPRLVGRDPTDYAQELQEFLRHLLSIQQGIPGGFGDADPVTIQADVAASAGVAGDGWASISHAHPVETDAAVDLANANGEGSSSALARANHLHKRTVRVAYNGVDIGTRNRINFLSTGGIPTDDAGNDEVDVPLAQTLDVEVVTSGPRTLNTSTDIGTVFTNEGAGAEVEFDLPAAVKDLFYIFYVQAAVGLQVNAQPGDTIRFETTTASAGGGIQSVTPGASILLLAINTTEWVALYYIPTWTTVAPPAGWNNNWWGPPASMYFG